MIGILPLRGQNDDMEAKAIKTIGVDSVWAMFLKSWDLVKFNYGLTLVICCLMGVGAFLAALPVMGPLLGGVVFALVPLIFLKAAQQWEQGAESSVEELLAVGRDQVMLNRMFPLLLIQLILFAGPQMIARLPYLNVLFGWVGLFAFPAQLVVGIAIPILLFNPHLSYQKSLTLAIDGIVKNIAPFAVGFCMMVAIVVITAAFFVIPLFVVGLPIVFVYHYIWYRVIYEGMEVEVPDQAII